MARFEGKTALITGGGSGTGAAIARLLAAEGASVAIVGRRVEKLRNVADEVVRSGGRALALQGDVSNPTDIEAAVSRTVAEFGGLHYAVNNAGVTGVFNPIGEMAIEDWQRVIGINLSGLFYGLRYELPAILASGGWFGRERL
jgi:NAD(P)-dependent dehydrogenase (short-subunit alcohol dehydrogenase family)